METQIIFICDRSGSMAAVKSDMEPAMNKFLDEQKALGEGTAKLKMVMFDTAYDIAYDGLLNSATPFKLQPRGCTALLDAIGKTLGGIDPTANSDLKTVVVILTDGLENSSVEWTKPQIVDLIKKLDSHDNLTITYLGANQDAIQEGQSLGVKAASSMTFDTSGDAVRRTVGVFSANIANYRSGLTGTVCYSDDDRKKARDN